MLLAGHADAQNLLAIDAGLADAVLVTPRCADPLYRRSVRVSMGTVFQVPWTRIDPWPAGMAELQEAGFTVGKVEDSTTEATKGEVLQQSPGEGTTLDQGSTVTIVVSTFEEPTPTPTPTTTPSPTATETPIVPPPAGG